MNSNIFSYLLDKYKQSLEKDNPKPSKSDKERQALKLANIETFVEYAKSYLDKTPPVAFDFQVEGHAVILSNGEKLRFLNPRTEESDAFFDTSVPITNLNTRG